MSLSTQMLKGSSLGKSLSQDPPRRRAQQISETGRWSYPLDLRAIADPVSKLCERPPNDFMSPSSQQSF
jgi:hypothetical protein